MNGKLNPESIQDNEAPDLWKQFHSDRARDFISNIVFIDDRPYISPGNDLNPTQEAAEMDTTEEDAFGSETQEEEVGQDLIEVLDVGARVSHELPVRELSSQFAKMGIATSFLFPEASENVDRVIDETQNVSNFADIVVLDWYLRDENSDLTLEILKKILENDENENGRMRLICIYTGEQPDTIPQTVLNALKDSFGSLTLEDGRIQGANLRIVVLNKNEIEPPSLANRLIAEFSEMVEGLMPSFALSAITVLRKNTHHLLSVFSKELDPAIVGHRMQLADSDDVETFGLDVLVMQLKSLLSTHTVHRQALSKERFEYWVERNCADKNPVTNLGGDLDVNVVKSLMNSSFDDRATQINNSKQQKKWKKAAHGFVFADTDSQSVSSVRMGRLSKLVREHDGMLPQPEGWLPTLGLGTVLRSQNDNGEGSYWLCTQPPCDSVRLEQSTFFPLLQLRLKNTAENEEDTKEYWVVIGKDESPKILKLKPNPKDGAFVMFSPNANTKRVMAEKNENGEFLFSGPNGQNYQWIADVEPLQAQRAVAAMTAQLNRVGVDEYEALRRGFPK